MHGRIVERKPGGGTKDRGGGFVVGPRTALTAVHCVRDTEPTMLELHSGSEVFAVTAVQVDDVIDAALLTFGRDVASPVWVDDAQDGDRWKVLVPPTPDDALIGGIVSSARRDYRTSGGAATVAMQLTADEDLGQFGGYSGSAITLPGRDGAVCGLLFHQQPQRGRTAGTARAASNVLYAVPIRDILDRFGIRAVGALRPSLPWDVPIDNLVAANRGPADQPLPFAGRDHELARLDAWLADGNAPRELVLVAPAGGGKTSLLIRWVHGLEASADPTLGGVAPVFVPISLNFDLARQDAVLGALLSRVGRVYGRRFATDRPVHDLQADLATLLRAPPPRPLLIVLDALDETLGWEAGPGLIPLDRHRNVRIVTSGRITADQPSAASWAATLGWHDAETFTLDRLTADGVGQVVAAPAELAELGDEVLRPLAAAVYKTADGDPLLVQLHVAGILDTFRNHGVLPDAGDIAATPPGLGPYIDRWWADLKRQWQAGSGGAAPHAGELFSVLSVARSYLNRREAIQVMRALVGADITIDGDVLDDALHGLSRFIAPAGDNIALAHPRLAYARRAMLVRDGELSRFEAAFRHWGANSIAGLEHSASPVPRYLLRHLGEHLAGASLRNVLPLASTQWRAAWEAEAELYRGYGADLERVDGALRAAATVQVSAGQPVTVLPAIVAIRAGAAVEAIGTRLVNSQLVAELVRHGVWTGGRAIGYVRDVDNSNGRAIALGQIAPFAGDVSDEEIIDMLAGLADALEVEFGEALAGACLRLARLGRLADAHMLASRWSEEGEPRGFSEAWALCQLLPYADDPTAARWARKAIAAWSAWRGYGRQELLDHLVANLPRDRARTVLGEDPVESLRRADAPAMAAERWRDDAAAGLVPAWLHDEERREREKRILTSLGADELDYLALEDLAPHLTDSLVPLALRVGDRIISNTRPLRFYVRLLGAACGSNRAAVESRVRAGLTEWGLSPRPEDLRDLRDLARNGLPNLALDVALGQPHPGGFMGAVEAIAPFLSEAQVRRALPDLIREAAEGRTEGLEALLARVASFGPGPAQEALATTRTLSHDRGEAAALEQAFAEQPRPGVGLSDGVLASTLAARAGSGRLDVAELVRTLRQLAGRSQYWRLLGAAVRSGALDGAAPQRCLELREAITAELAHEYEPLQVLTGLPDVARELARGASAEVAGDLVFSLPPNLAVVTALGIRGLLTPPVAALLRRVADAPDSDPWTVALARASLDDEAAFLTALADAQKRVPAEKRIVPLLRHLSAAWRANAAHVVVPDTVFEGRMITKWDGFEKALEKRLGRILQPFDWDWVDKIGFVLEALDRVGLDRLMDLVARQVHSASQRQKIRAAAAVRWAQLGEVERALDAAQRAFDVPEALADVAQFLPVDALPAWVTAVAERLSGFSHDAERLAAWTGAAPRWREADAALHWRSLESWLDVRPPEGRRGLAYDLIGLAPCLLRLGDTRVSDLMPRAALEPVTIGLLRELAG